MADWIVNQCGAGSIGVQLAVEDQLHPGGDQPGDVADDTPVQGILRGVEAGPSGARISRFRRTPERKCRRPGEGVDPVAVAGGLGQRRKAARQLDDRGEGPQVQQPGQVSRDGQQESVRRVRYVEGFGEQGDIGRTAAARVRATVKDGNELRAASLVSERCPRDHVAASPEMGLCGGRQGVGDDDEGCVRQLPAQGRVAREGRQDLSLWGRRRVVLAATGPGCRDGHGHLGDGGGQGRGRLVNIGDDEAVLLAVRMLLQPRRDDVGEVRHTLGHHEHLVG